MCSIFATPEEASEWAVTHGKHKPIRPLKPNTMKRIARGVERFVINAQNPFIYRGLATVLTEITHQGDRRSKSVADPLHTIRCASRGETALVASSLSTYYGDKLGAKARGQSLSEPLATQTTENRHALVSAFLSQHNGGFYDGPGRAIEEPLSTILSNGRGHQPLIAAHIQRDFGTGTGHGCDQPVGTLTTEGGGKAALVASFLSQYNGTAVGQEVTDPINTIPSHDRFGLVTIEVDGKPHCIIDIAMRMLTPRELFLCQGFPPQYVIDRTASGEPITKTEQVQMVGNSVSPPLAAALVRANCPDLIARPAKEMAS
jgi:DNA (cytosine-5)-methyltransferase 1